MSEKVNHPEHYRHGDVETIDVIKAFTQNCTGPESFYIGNIIKYVSRFKKKNGVEDLRKAEWYLTHLIEYEDPDSYNKETRPESPDEITIDIEQLPNGDIIITSKAGDRRCLKKIAREDLLKKESE